MTQLFLFLLLPLLSFAQIEQKPIWIDTDNRMGKVKGDVDDGLALMLALSDSTINIRGITTVQNTRYAQKVTLKLLNWYGSGMAIPVYSGAESSKESGIETDAVKALAEALMKERLTIVALGTATNIASLLHLHPEVTPQIEQIIFCMGRTPGLRFNPNDGKREFSDYNFESDIEAIRQILKTNVRISFVGYEPASYIYLDKTDVQAFRNNGRIGDKWVYRQLKAWNWKWKMFYGSKKGFIPFDAITMGYLLKPEYLTCGSEAPVAIEAQGNDKQLALLVSLTIKSDKKVEYCSFTQVAFKEYLMKQLLKK
ncbi:MAG: nucleoside hydrolase [Chitinophagales bacterium]|nr:nucleoside hydrolase [Chitinophagales bacterium]